MHLIVIKSFRHSCNDASKCCNFGSHLCAKEGLAFTSEIMSEPGCRRVTAWASMSPIVEIAPQVSADLTIPWLRLACTITSIAEGEGTLLSIL